MIELEMKNDKAIVRLNDEVTIENAADLKMILIKAFDEADQIMLDVSNLSATDITCLQLICSANKTAAELDKQLTLTGHSEVLKNTADLAGFTSYWENNMVCVE